jgi:predicted TIM-barrel fold metal-dependent hydrolase
MEIIDGQIHCWERAPSRPWHDDPVPAGIDHGIAFPVEDAITAMDALGVDAAVLSLPPGYRTEVAPGIPRFDNSYAEEAALRYPGRFASVTRFDPRDPDLDDRMAQSLHRPGTVGTRVTVFGPEQGQRFESGFYDPVFVAANRHGVPLMLAVLGYPERAGTVATAFPGLSVIVDHFGLPQEPMGRDADPFERLPRLLALAELPNVSVKFGAAPALSLERYPYRDVWPGLHKVIDAFGPHRLMWASDVTRVRPHHTYAEALWYLLHSDELSTGDKELILGQSLRRILNWPKNGAPS